MPLYEYECTACRKHTEKIQKFSDAEITICPHCGGTLERVITAPAIAFKGGGWYADGYGNAKPAASETKGESKSENAAQASSETKSGNKPSGGSDTSNTPPAAAPTPASAPAAAASSSSDSK